MKKQFLKTENLKQVKKMNFMKTVSILFVLLFGLLGVGNAESYHEAMQTALDSFQQARTIEQFQEVANKFETIANAKKSLWLPDYYAARVYIIMSFLEKDNNKKDAFLDKAQTFVDKCQAIDKNNSEVYVLQGFLYQARISVSPMLRGQKYSGLASQSMQEALKINPDNPRAYYLLGQNILHTPAMFGGGTKAAYPYLIKAQNKYKIFKPQTDISPNWGQKRNEKLIEYCNKQKNK